MSDRGKSTHSTGPYSGVTETDDLAQLAEATRVRTERTDASNGSEEPYRVIPTIGALSTWPSMEPRKGTPKLKIPPSAAIR